MRAISLVFVLAIASAAYADPPPLALRYDLEATEVKEGETFQLDVVFTVLGQQQVEELSLPDLPRAFTVLQERRGTSTQIRNDGRKRVIIVEQKYVYTLRADDVGTFKIGEATARLGGAVAKAPAVLVKVTEGNHDGATPQDASSAGSRYGANPPTTFIEVTPDKHTAWVGQQVTVTTEIYTTQPLAQWPRLPPIKPPGFFCASLLEGDKRPAPAQKTVSGKPYYVYLVNKDALFALDAGKKVVPALTVDLVPTGSLFSRTRAVHAKTDPINLDIKALPPGAQGKNPVVGIWQLAASVRPQKAPLGEPVTLTLTATGVGSIEQVQLPSWEGGPDVRVFPPSTRLERRPASESDALLGGRVIAEMLVQPQREGEIRIPSFTLTTFDPDTAAYKDSTTSPITLTVLAAKKGAQSSANGGGRQTIAKGARPLHTNIHTAPPASAAPLVAGASVFGAGLITFAIGTARRRRRHSAGGKRAELAHERARILKDAANRGDLAGLQRAVLDVLADAYGGDVKADATSALGPRLEAQGAPPDIVIDVVQFIKDVEATRFLPGGGGERERLADTAQRLVARIEGRS